MGASEIHAVTGAFGYSGQYITRRLHDLGVGVRTVTNSPSRSNPFDFDIDIQRFNFDRPDRLTESLRGVRVLYNTYWIRFNHRRFKQSDAVRNTKILFDAAAEAGVERIVHVSITNPSIDSPLEYFRSKAELEDSLQHCGMSYAILRPAVLFGKEDVLINNIAWILRRFPFFGAFGDGTYRLQPIYVDDLAMLTVEHGASRENVTIDAIGPETFTYRELVAKIGEIIGKPRKVISMPPWLGHMIGSVVGKAVGDVIITRAEIRGLMDELLYVESKPPAHGMMKLTEWTRNHAKTIGLRYTSEMARRIDRVGAYAGNEVLFDGCFVWRLYGCAIGMNV